jgi:aminopeptidase N
LEESAKRLEISFPRTPGPVVLSIAYEGRVYDPVTKERSLQFVRGDQTSGLIGPEGIYLPPQSLWYPDAPDSRAHFLVEATIPSPFRIVTQGELLSEELKDGHRKSRWEYGLPSEGLTLVGGRFSVKTRSVVGVRLSTYFFSDDDRFSEIFLDAAERILTIYSALLGKFPFKKFDIVENFFSSGYSFPTFTLLAPEAIRRGREFLRPGALDHEIVHSWWGHYVSEKPGIGNWVEALTTYCTNYYSRELEMSEEDVRKYREDVLQKYAIQVPPSRDYPLRQFQGKRDEVDGQIGYGKGSMVFHMLRQIVGSDVFFETLRQFSREYGGKQASWQEIQKVFETSSGRRLDVFFRQWLDRMGGPKLKLEAVQTRTSTRGYRVDGEVVQEGDVYELPLPLEIDDGVEKRRILLEASKRRNPFSVEIPNWPLTLKVDPDSHVFRRLYPEEIVPGLNALLEEQEKIFVLPDEDEEKAMETYEILAGMMQRQKGGRILSERDITEAEIKNTSLVLLGTSWKNPIFSDFLSNIPNPVRVKEGLFYLDGDPMVGDESLLLTFHHPLEKQRWVTIYFGASTEALGRARYIFFYGWDSYILFKKGKPFKWGDFPPFRSFVSHRFQSEDGPKKADRQTGRGGKIKHYSRSER